MLGSTRQKQKPACYRRAGFDVGSEDALRERRVTLLAAKGPIERRGVHVSAYPAFPGLVRMRRLA